MTALDALDPFDRFALSLPALPRASPPQVDNPDRVAESIPNAVEALDSLAQTGEGATAPVPTLGAQQVVLLDPCLIRPGSVPNRDKAAFDRVEFRHLQASITLGGVNVQPILVRRALLDDAGTVYEIIYGARRHQACLLAGLPVRALVQDGIDEGVKAGVNAEVNTPVNAAADFLATFRENQGRADLAPWELGRQIAFALARGYFSSQRKAAQEIGRDVGDVSRALQLAALASEVVSAFATPLDLQFRHAKPLSDALKKAPEAVLAEALRIQAEGKALAPGQVLARLVAAADESKAQIEAEAEAGVGPSNTAPLDVAIEVEGQAIARLVTGRDGLVQVRMAQALNDKQRTQLAEQLRAFYKRCVAKAAPRSPPQAGVR